MLDFVLRVLAIIVSAGVTLFVVAVMAGTIQILLRQYRTGGENSIQHNDEQVNYVVRRDDNVIQRG